MQSVKALEGVSIAILTLEVPEILRKMWDMGLN